MLTLIIRDLQSFCNNAASLGPQLVQVRVPELHKSLVSEPSLVYKETVNLQIVKSANEINHHMSAGCAYHASAIFLPASFFGSPNDLGSNNSAVRRRDTGHLHLTRHALLNEMAQPQTHFCNFGRRYARSHLIMIVSWQHYSKEQQLSATHCTRACPVTPIAKTCIVGLTSSFFLTEPFVPSCSSIPVCPAAQKAINSRPPRNVRHDAVQNELRSWQ